jgi:hypothetical protein
MPTSSRMHGSREISCGSFEWNSASTGLAIRAIAPNRFCPAMYCDLRNRWELLRAWSPAQRPDFCGFEHLGVAGPVRGTVSRGRRRQVGCGPEALCAGRRNCRSLGFARDDKVRSLVDLKLCGPRGNLGQPSCSMLGSSGARSRTRRSMA